MADPCYFAVLIFYPEGITAITFKDPSLCVKVYEATLTKKIIKKNKAVRTPVSVIVLRLADNN